MPAKPGAPGRPAAADTPASHLYFAYGSNLDHDGMGSRCPGAVPVEIGVIDGWALTFRGVADIKPSDGSLTHGAIWRIDDHNLGCLDRYEGCPRLYRRELLPVRTAAGELHAIAYVMNDDYVGLPSPSYYRVIARGYEQWDLPLDALEAAVAEVKKRLARLGVTSFVADGPKRLRPA